MRLTTRFLRLARYQLGAKIVMGTIYDGICKSCRGGENRWGDHCSRHRSDFERRTTESLFRSGMYGAIEATAGNINSEHYFDRLVGLDEKVLVFPLRYFFDLELMFRVMKSYYEIWRRVSIDD